MVAECKTFLRINYSSHHPVSALANNAYSGDIQRLAADMNDHVALGLRGIAVERQSLASIHSPYCARPVADG